MNIRITNFNYHSPQECSEMDKYQEHHNCRILKVGAVLWSWPGLPGKNMEAEMCYSMRGSNQHLFYHVCDSFCHCYCCCCGGGGGGDCCCCCSHNSLGCGPISMIYYLVRAHKCSHSQCCPASSSQGFGLVLVVAGLVLPLWSPNKLYRLVSWNRCKSKKKSSIQILFFLCFYHVFFIVRS